MPLIYNRNRSELFLLHSQVKFSSMLHKRIPAEAGISIICASPGIVDTNVVSSISISFVVWSFVLFQEVDYYYYYIYIYIYNMHAYPTFTFREI
jgi:hypothetical protein